MTKKEAWQRLHDHCKINGMFWMDTGQAVGLCGMLNHRRSEVGVDGTLWGEMEYDLSLFRPQDGDVSENSAWWGGPRGEYTPLRQTIVEFLIAMSED